MKKFILLLFLCISSNLGALENFNIRWSISNLGFGMFVPLDIALEIDLFNIELEHRNSKIGIEWSPIKLWKLSSNNYSSMESLRYSFLNFGIYWNILEFNKMNPSRSKFFFDLVNKINYIHADKRSGLNWDEFVYTAGLRFQYSYYISGNTYYNLLSSEIGYRNINRANTLYFNISVDIIMFIYLYMDSGSAKHPKKSKK